jgi:hypothetical protein
MVKVPRPDIGRPSDALRSAIERTFEATAHGAARTGDRAVELLDEVARHAREARDQLGKLESRIESTVRPKKKP